MIADAAGEALDAVAAVLRLAPDISARPGAVLRLAAGSAFARRPSWRSRGALLVLASGLYRLLMARRMRGYDDAQA